MYVHQELSPSVKRTTLWIQPLFKILPKEKHREKAISTDSCRTLVCHQPFSRGDFPRVLGEHCKILAQSITKNNTEVCCTINFHKYINRHFWRIGYSTLKSLKKELFKMFKCDICEKTFTRERNMRRHKENVHGKSTGVCCNKCNKSFSRVDNLKRHEKVCSKYFFFRFI